MASFVQNLEAAAKLTALVRRNMEGIAQASQSIAQISTGGGSTLVIGGGGGDGGSSGMTGTASPFGGKLGMGGAGSGGGGGMTYGAAGSAFLRSAVVPQTRDAAAIVSVLQQLPAAIAKEIGKQTGAGMLRAMGGL